MKKKANPKMKTKMKTEASEFKRGWGFVANNIGVQHEVLKKADYVGSIDSAIDVLKENLEKYLGHGGKPSIFGGKVVEDWHGGTFNIIAALMESDDFAVVLRSRGLGSVDIHLKSGKDYSSKYMENALKSVRQQIKIFQNAYDEYAGKLRSKGKIPLSPDEYLNKHGYKDMEVMLYEGQHRLIPSNQLKDAKTWVKYQIDNLTDANEIAKYKELEALLTDVLEGSDGVQSLRISKDKCTELATLLQAGKNKKPEDFKKELEAFIKNEGISKNQLITNDIILKQALKSGCTAAVMSMVLQTAPVIIDLIKHLIKHGYIDISHVKQTGTAVLKGGAEGFLTGSISAALTTKYLSMESIKVTDVLSSSAIPNIIGAMTVIAVRAIKCSFGVATGNMTDVQFVDTITRDITATAFTLGIGELGKSLFFGLSKSAFAKASLGAMLLPSLPVFGYMLGSFVGGVVGGLVYTGAKKLCLSLCVETGFTFFGLVKQNYTLPEEIVEELGLEVFDYEKFDYDSFEYGEFEYESLDYTEFAYEPINICILRRGVIGVNTIGYVA